MNTELMEDLYAWVDRIPFSRPKKDLKRDFSDGVLIAELVKHFFPSYVDLHNYPSALGVNNKIANWKILNRKVFRKLKFEISEDVIRSIVTCQPNAIQQFLLLLRCKIESILNCDPTKHEVDHPKIMRDIQEDNCSGEHIMKKNSSIGKNDKKVAYQEGATGNQGEIINNIQQILVNKEAELFSKDEMIDVLKARVRKLENMLELKDTHIRELQKILKKNASQAQVGAPTELTTH